MLKSFEVTLAGGVCTGKLPNSALTNSLRFKLVCIYCLHNKAGILQMNILSINRHTITEDSQLETEDLK